MADCFSKANLRDCIRVEAGFQSLWNGIAVLGGDGAAFGGQMAAQALMAARTIAHDRLPESIHSFFLARALPGETIEHDVQALRSGRSFSLARVETRQNGRHCLSSVVSFHNGETAPSHQTPMPSVAPPDACAPSHFIPQGTNPDVRRCFDIRSVDGIPTLGDGQYPRQTYWFRHKGDLGDDPAVHAAALVWFSDLSMPWTTDLAYDESHGRRIGASLDHTVWFHRPARADRWLLFVQESLVYAGARAMTRGVFYSEDGALVASAAQETLLRRIL